MPRFLIESLSFCICPIMVRLHHLQSMNKVCWTCRDDTFEYSPRPLHLDFPLKLISPISLTVCMVTIKSIIKFHPLNAGIIVSLY